jgi:hypothetical protein
MSKYIKLHTLSVGYNIDLGQQFFDLLHEYDEYIHSYFFSVHERFYNNPNQPELQYDDVIDNLALLNTYNYPANLLFNNYNNKNFEIYNHTIDKLLNVGINIKAVTVLDLDLAKLIKTDFPQLEIHSSVRYFDTYLRNYMNLTPVNFIDHINDFIGLIDVVNLSGTYSMFDYDIQNKCRELGFKIKYITNEGCIRNRDLNYSKFKGYENNKCYNPDKGCQILCTNKLVKSYPWLELARANLYKESIQYIDYDILKISGRNISDINKIRSMLNYWTSDDGTNYIANISMYNDINTYNIFKEYIRDSATCNGMCKECRKCEKYYSRMILSSTKYENIYQR